MWALNGRSTYFPKDLIGLRTIDKLRTIELCSTFQTTSPTFDLLKKNCYSIVGTVNSILNSDECNQILESLKKYEKNLYTEFVEETPDTELERRMLVDQDIIRMENLKSTYSSEVRSGRRLVFIEEKLSALLWDRIKSQLKLEEIFKNQEVSNCPRGFSVLPENNWKFSGVNACLRANLYETTNFFNFHKDSQYCPSANERSILSGIIYLNDDYEGGETTVHFPAKCDCGKLFDENHKIPEISSATSEECIAADSAFEQNLLKVSPKAGNCLLFSPHLLHKGEPVASGKKWILRFDILVSRYTCIESNAEAHHYDEICLECASNISQTPEKRVSSDCLSCQGFLVHPAEQPSYDEALIHFRNAQILELEQNEKNNRIVNEYYEKCLSLRYSFPQALHHLLDGKKNIPESASTSNISDSYFLQVPGSVWENVFDYAGAKAAKNFGLAFPIPIGLVRAEWERKRKERFESDSDWPKEKFIPLLHYQYGYLSCFEFTDAAFFREHQEDCLRVVAFYAFSLLGQCKGFPPYQADTSYYAQPRAKHEMAEHENRYYTVRYDPAHNTICCIPLNELLADVFYKRPSFGSIYSVYRQAASKQPVTDFVNSVDRSWTRMYHQREFTGLDYIDMLKTSNTKMLIDDLIYSETEDSDENVDDENEYEGKITRVKTPPAITQFCYVTGESVEPILDGIEKSWEEVFTRISFPSLPKRKQNPKPLVEFDRDEVGCCFVSNLKWNKRKFHFCPTGRNEECIYWNPHVKKINHLIFNFEEQELLVTEKATNSTWINKYLNEYSVSVSRNYYAIAKPRIERYSVSVAPILPVSGVSFNHASCQCYFPFSKSEIETVKLLRYPKLKDVFLSVIETPANSILVYATYDGIVSM